MNIKIYLDRYTETCNIAGTQFEQNATVIKFDFSELDFLDDECVKTIHFFHDDLSEENYIGDSIIQNDEFKIPKSITKYEDVLAFIQITKEDFIWKTRSFNLDFYKSLDVDKTLDEDEIGILQELILEVKEIQNVTAEKFEEAAEKATEDFNKNATEKLNDFNDNYTDKLNSFNENSNSKVNNYNSNAESKTEDFNANADNQKSNFDNNVTEKTNTFNSNTESKITEFNSNATSKTDSFNSNATSKETSYNENAIAKLNEYNENHTIKMNAYNDNTTEKITEYNENAAEKIAEYDEHIEDLDNIVSKNTVNGESISIDDALAYKIFGAKVDGNAEQTTTTGKNLYKPTETDFLKNGVNVTIEENVITLNGEMITGVAEFNVGADVEIEANQYYKLSYHVLGGTGKMSHIHSELKVGDKKTWGWLSSRQVAKSSSEAGILDKMIIYCDEKTTFNNYQIVIQVEKVDSEDSPATDYEPYTGGETSPNPDYPQEIETITNSVKIVQTGKNLFDKNGDFTHGNNNNLTTLQEDGTIKTTANFSNQRSSGQLISVDKNTNYTVSGILVEAQSPNNTVIEILNENNTRIHMFEISNSANYNFSFTFNSADNEKIWISLNARDFNLSASVYAIFDKIQIEEGTVSTDYEDYKSNEYTIDLQNNELVKLTDDIKDIIEIDKLGNVSLLKNTTKKIFDGTESWNEFDNQYLMNCVRFRLNYDINDINALCDKLQLKLANEYWTNDVECLGYSDTSHYIVGQIKKSRLDENASLQSFKDFLAENNLTVYHKTTELTTTSLGQLANFKTYAGINHFFLEANLSTNFEIKYAQDLQEVISKQQEEIDELKTLLSSTATSALLLDNYESDLINEIESEV